MSFDPKFFGAVVSMDHGDARIMCMAQQGEDDSLSIHFFKVDTTLTDTPFNYPTEGELSFSEELRGTGLAVAIAQNPTDPVEEIIMRRLTEAYGASATVSIKQIERPSLVSLFM